MKDTENIVERFETLLSVVQETKPCETPILISGASAQTTNIQNTRIVFHYTMSV